ncbi:hypothetical protein [Paenibacillus wynnii]|uniref:hypothetical protein n=1 Tax=Paenibacillus wynnii TaxID=268407 RepID=UPI002793E9A3|nr:hypothetical protein [Paenibacillus wynnii]MDQ0196133.1 hypothetical protein [Paenibacillus wynnii]
MKDEHQQDGFRSNEERPLKFNAGDQAWDGVSFSVSLKSASAESESVGGSRETAERFNRSYFSRTELHPEFLVLREGENDRRVVTAGNPATAAGPCLVRSEAWLLKPELEKLYNTWITSDNEAETDRVLQRIYYILRSTAAGLLESSDGNWVAVTLPFTPELSARPLKLNALQDVQLEALFAALGERYRQGCDSRVDLLAPYPASGAEFAAMREFIETVAEQTLGHAFAATCRIGALLAPDAHRAAEEIVRIADFLVLDGAAMAAAPEDDAAAEGFALAAGQVLTAVRRIKPAAVVLAAGAPAASALADLYRIGLNGIFCSADQRTEALLRAACLTWMARQETFEHTEGVRAVK